ncbi:metal-dependent hydrolase [Hanstruepera neustonica]|uniref:Metal-dependent hydrolase n=1 Tax=Hanstruepera neustonica TaxID=1445657 RepID=A0A2K1DXU4_9FLAO|nr:SprT family zinc-dependent metalloprotease [Hanstruepera neustonica]PNQ72848.1 metal-dependent hydrolase [Hanstruepera neustonica]
MKDFIDFGSHRIDYSIKFSDRKTLGITVNPELEVIVKSPENISKEIIKKKIKNKAPWIIKQQSYFLSFQPRSVKKKYVSGETHLYLGRQYRLKLTLSKTSEVKYKGRFIEIFTPKKANAEELMLQWYKTRAKVKFSEIAEPLIQRFKKYNVEPNGMYIQNMAKRWGSCTPKGKIILNPELIKAPKACIEYVIIHELCHLIYHNHTKKFFDLQDKEMPDWRKWKSKLENLLA